jgi:hypothetical protein
LDTLQNILFVAPVLLFSVIAHEYAHGYAALKQGDPTAQSLGRLTWNPAKHIDPYMTVILPLIMLVASQGRIALGGAKPVPVDPRNYRHYKRGDIIVSLAGVFTNFLIALACTGAVVLVGLLGRAVPVIGPTLAILQAMFVKPHSDSAARRIARRQASAAASARCALPADRLARFGDPHCTARVRRTAARSVAAARDDRHRVSAPMGATIYPPCDLSVAGLLTFDPAK